MMTLRRQAIAAFLLCLAFLCFLSLISFNPMDSSLHAITIPPVEPANWVGLFGAYISASLISVLGATAFVVPVLLGTYAFSLWRNKFKAHFFAHQIVNALMIFLSVQVLSSVASEVSIQHIKFPTQGWLGLVFSREMINAIGVVGLVVFYVNLFLVIVLFKLHDEAFVLAFAKLRRWLTRFNLNTMRRKYSVAIKTKQSKQNSNLTEPSLETPSFREDQANLPEADKIEASTESSTSIIRPMSAYKKPSLNVFKCSDKVKQHESLADKKLMEETSRQLISAFKDFGVQGEVIEILPGPVVTVFEFQAEAGVKLSKIIGLVDDIALALHVDSIIILPVNGKRAVGVQVPNKNREMVRLGDLLINESFQSSGATLTLALGKTISGNSVYADLTKMPHLLTAGATGSGKSVAINALLCSLLARCSPDELRLILVDPKMLELSIYEGIPHLLMPVITDPQRSAIALQWAIQEMERRYRLMQTMQVRNIAGFNELVVGPESSTRFSHLDKEDRKHLPYIVIIIDELADLMMTAPKEVEGSVQRLAQKARASGIHLILATQRPSVDIITGVIKANLPCRAAFQVVSKHDSRTILDQQGADKLLGNGDMLFQRPGSGRIERIQSPFVSDDEVVNLVSDIKSKNPPSYDKDLVEWVNAEAARAQNNEPDSLEDGDDDAKFEDAVQIAATQGNISASYLQRQLKIGYNRAARIVERMEHRGWVAKSDGVKPRKWLGRESSKDATP